MRLVFIAAFLAFSLSAFGNELPFRLKAVVSMGDKVMCSIQNTKTNKSFWLKMNEPVPELDGFIIININSKNSWVDIKNDEESFILAAKGMFLRSNRGAISVEESGLSNMVNVFKNSKK